MGDEYAHKTAEEERERRDHEAEAREREPHERRGEDDDTPEGGGPPANIQPGTNTGS
jgi:hypothetical protein